MPRLYIDVSSNNTARRIMGMVNLNFGVRAHLENEESRLSRELLQELKLDREQRERSEKMSKEFLREMLEVISRRFDEVSPRRFDEVSPLPPSEREWLDHEGKLKPDYELYAGTVYYRGLPIFKEY